MFTFNASKTGNAYADFLLGLPATITQDAPIRKIDNGAYLSLFAQDDFRIHPRVTLNLGIRYDLQFPLHRSAGSQARVRARAAVDVSPNAPVGLLFPGDDGISRGIVETDRNNIAPRLGIAWDPMGDGRMSVRGGCGIFYGSITGNEWNTTADNQPFTVRQSFPTVFTLSDPYRNLPGGVGPFPFIYNPGRPRFTLPAQVFGPSLDFVWPIDVSDEPDGPERASARSERERVLRWRARPQPAARASIATIRCSTPGSDGRQRQHAAAVSAGRRSARRACWNRSSAATITASS